MLHFSAFDLVALAWFVGAWIGYVIALETTAYGRTGLNALVNSYRDRWMQQLLTREMRMVDGQVTASLQNGTAFFASTSLIAVGGTLTLFRSTDDLLQLVAQLPLGIVTTRLQWEAKLLGLVVIFVYAFFKFAWSYRLFNYVAIMIGAAPPVAESDTPAAREFVHRASALCRDAGRHFNRGQRAFFFALGYLGWFIGPAVLIAATTGVVIVMWRRQFASESRHAFLDAGAGSRG
ncbi:MAG: DUF599 family protein [Rhizobiales bacterium]|nr:DUF599 family protein [Hyphomicrobiales bacterium]